MTPDNNGDTHFQVTFILFFPIITSEINKLAPFKISYILRCGQKPCEKLFKSLL